MKPSEWNTEPQNDEFLADFIIRVLFIKQECAHDRVGDLGPLKVNW